MMMMITELPEEVRNLRPKPGDVNNWSRSPVKKKTSQNKRHPQNTIIIIIIIIITMAYILYKTEGEKTECFLKNPKP